MFAQILSFTYYVGAVYFAEGINVLQCMVYSESDRSKSQPYSHGNLQNCTDVMMNYHVGCVTGYQVIRVIRIFEKTYPFEYQSGIIRKYRLLDFLYLK